MTRSDRRMDPLRVFFWGEAIPARRTGGRLSILWWLREPRWCLFERFEQRLRRMPGRLERVDDGARGATFRLFLPAQNGNINATVRAGPVASRPGAGGGCGGGGEVAG